MFYRPAMEFFGSQLFGNLILLVTAIIALAVGWRQVYLNDVVEIYAIPGEKQLLNRETGQITGSTPIISLQNVGTRLVYMNKYIFNGTEYPTENQVLPSTYSQAQAGYWIELPTNGQNHVAITVFYHDLDERYWKSQIIADLQSNQSWKVRSLPRTNISKNQI